MFGHQNALYDAAFKDFFGLQPLSVSRAFLPYETETHGHICVRALFVYGGSCPHMNYHMNFNLIWRHFDKLWQGLVLSLELAVLSILIGAVIGLLLAIWYVSAGKAARSLISAYVEIVRNVPLILLVYIVFYGIPTVVDIAYSPTVSFCRHLVSLRRGISG